MDFKAAVLTQRAEEYRHYEGGRIEPFTPRFPEQPGFSLLIRTNKEQNIFSKNIILKK